MTVQWPSHSFEDRKKMYDLIMECELLVDEHYAMPIDTINAIDADLNLLCMQSVEKGILWNEAHHYFGAAENLKHRLKHIMKPWFAKAEMIRKAKEDSEMV